MSHTPDRMKRCVTSALPRPRYSLGNVVYCGTLASSPVPTTTEVCSGSVSITLVSGVNYFSRSATTIFPYRRQLQAPPATGCSSRLPDTSNHPVREE